MNNLSKTILIISIAILGASALGVSVAQANSNGLVVEFEGNLLNDPLIPLFNQANFMPGDSVTRWVKVTNNSTTTQSIAAEAINYPGFPVNTGDAPDIPVDDLSRALEIIIREQGGPDLYGGSTGVKTLFKFYEKGETYLSDVAKDDTQEYEFEISFSSDKGDYWQSKTTGFDILVGFCEDCENSGDIEPPTVPDCNDGIDNDGDTYIDMDDPGCTSLTDNDESNDGGGGGGGGIPLGLTIQYENSTTTVSTAIITWLTSYNSTSRVIYDIVPDKFNLYAGEPGYGYTYYTDEFNTPANPNGVTGHTVEIHNLDENTTYYFRCVSHASPDTIGIEHSFTTLAMGDTGAEGDAGDGDGDGDAGDGSGDTGDGDVGDGDAGDGSSDGDTGSEGGTGDDSDDTGDTGDEGGVGDEEFEYGDHIYEHQEDQADDQLSIIDDEFGDDSGDASKFLASIGAFFGDLEGWRLALMFLLWIILALIIIRLIKSWIDRKKNNQ